MINWMYFPKNQTIDDISKQVLKVFNEIAFSIDSNKYQLQSNEVLSLAAPGLEKIGFQVEKSKKSSDVVAVPVLYGKNGKIEKSFKADGYYAEYGYVIEIEAGRGVTNYQFLKDFFEACTMIGVDRLCIAVRNIYKASYDFEKVCLFFETMYASNRIGNPLSNILVIGY